MWHKHCTYSLAAAIVSHDDCKRVVELNHIDLLVVESSALEMKVAMSMLSIALLDELAVFELTVSSGYLYDSCIQRRARQVISCSLLRRYRPSRG